MDAGSVSSSCLITLRLDPTTKCCDGCNGPAMLNTTFNWSMKQ